MSKLPTGKWISYKVDLKSTATVYKYVTLPQYIGTIRQYGFNGICEVLIGYVQLNKMVVWFKHSAHKNLFSAKHCLVDAIRRDVKERSKKGRRK